MISQAECLGSSALDDAGMQHRFRCANGAAPPATRKVKEHRMSNLTFLRWTVAGLLGVAATFSAALPVEALTCTSFGTSLSCEGASVRAVGTQVAEPKGSTTSDGPGSPYTDARKKQPPTKKKQPSSQDRWFCEQNCPYPAGSSRQEQCIQQCLNRRRR